MFRAAHTPALVPVLWLVNLVQPLKKNRTFRKPVLRPSLGREAHNLLYTLDRVARHSRNTQLVKIWTREKIASTDSNGKLATEKLKTTTRQK
jgi:hypothetical protein